MLKKRLLASFAYSEPYFIKYCINETVIETQPPYCYICKQYLTEFSCNSIKPVNCPYFHDENLQNPNKKKEV